MNYNNNNNPNNSGIPISNNPTGSGYHRSVVVNNNLSSPHPGLNLNSSTSLTPQQQQILQQAHLIQQQQAILQQQHQSSTTSNHPIPSSQQQQPPQPPPQQQQPNQHQISQHQAMIQQQQLILQQQQQQQQRQMPRTPVPQLPPQSNPSPIPNPQNIKRPMPAFNEIVGPNPAYTRAKRNKPTDRRLPNFSKGSQELINLSDQFNKLQSIEEKIDWTISRKRLELEDSLKKTLAVKRRMRIKVWNTVDGQSWQKGFGDLENKKEELGKDSETVGQEKDTEENEKEKGGEEGDKNGGEEGVQGGDDQAEQIGESKQEKIEQQDKETKEIKMLSSIEAVPKWTLHIEGMLLDHPTSSEAKETLPKIMETKRPFSSLITGLLIKVERPDELYPEPNFVEWQRRTNPTTPSPNEFSEFKFTRTGSERCQIRLAFHLDQFPQRLKLMPILGDVLDLKEASLSEIMDSIWRYVKKERLQDSMDKRQIKKDQKLACLFPPMCDKMPFHQLTDSVRRFIGMSEPVRIDYEIDVEEGCEGKAKYYDVEFSIEDPAKLHMMKVKESLDGQDQISKEIIALDEQIMESIAKLKEIKSKRDFYQEFSKDPISFIKRWINSQSEDLNELLGLEDDRKRSSDFYQNNDWIHEAIKVYQLREFNSKVVNSSTSSQQQQPLHSQHPHPLQHPNGSLGNINHAVGAGFGGLNSVVGHGINHNMNQIRR